MTLWPKERNYYYSLSTIDPQIVIILNGCNANYKRWFDKSWYHAVLPAVSPRWTWMNCRGSKFNFRKCFGGGGLEPSAPTTDSARRIKAIIPYYLLKLIGIETEQIDSGCPTSGNKSAGRAQCSLALYKTKKATYLKSYHMLCQLSQFPR